MNHFAPSRLAAAALAVALVHLPTAARACAVCTGQGDSTTTVDEAMNGAIFFMLGVLVVTMGLIVAVAVSLMRRASNPIPAHVQLAEYIGTPTATK